LEVFEKSIVMTKKKTNMVTLSEAKLEELITKIVAKRLNEDANFNAIRTLTIKAQETALKFEDELVKMLNVIDPNQMNDVQQDVYAHVMADLHQAFATSVANAAKAVSRLPKNPVEEKPSKKTSAPGSSQPATAVKKDLPTLG
jgi:hypothetical protein